MRHDIRGRNDNERVRFSDASDLGMSPGKFPAAIDVLTERGEELFVIVGFSRNVEGEIIVALYTNDKHEILRVFND